MTENLIHILARPRTQFTIFGLLAAAALAAAYTAQYVYGLEPCILCLYQRVPMFFIIAVCALGVIISGPAHGVKTRLTLGVAALAYLANAGIAFYHTGVERKWWASFLEGCTIPEIKGNITDVLAQIESTPPARCDEIPWTDPLIGLSMANYNVLFCGVLALAALYAATRRA